ncbi:MAG: hypothetical protein DRP45_11870 [Candidatus Zixiibacteriota bacterium]|nr:MAG: hypothetical protein DRP45_11870 [candidate division Zixibacteria bacterium]
MKSAKQRLTDRIKAGKIQRRLQEFAVSKPTDENFADVQMSPPQVNAAKILLGKVVPDLKQVEQTIRDERKKTKQDIDNALIAKGIDPDTVWGEVVKH